MPKRNKKSWSDRRRHAVHVAEQLVVLTSSSFPTNLGAMAAARLVNQIQFKPLLTDGGLAVHEDGFVIYVRCEPAEAADFTGRLLDDGTGKSLPLKIVRRARFTIAHEIAHTLFYDLRTKPPRLKVNLRDPAAHTSLELGCNELAGILLLPETLLQREYSNSEFVRPEEIRRLADKALVSSQTIVRRFQQLRRSAHPDAILASLSRQQHEWRISAISRHYSLRSLFLQAKVGAPLETLISDPDFILFGGEMDDVKIPFVGHGGRPTNILFACERLGNTNSKCDVIIAGTPVRQ
jgi:hypothetical protein